MGYAEVKVKQEMCMLDSQTVSASQCRAARAQLGMSQAELARIAGLSPRTVIKFENGEKAERKTVLALKAALTDKGVRVVEGEAGEGVIWPRP